MFTLLTIFFLQFANKAGSDVVCLSPTAMEMREKRGIAIDSLDYAVSPLYLDSVRALGASVLHCSRWMNGATVEASESVIREVEQCSFVETIYLSRGEQQAQDISAVSLRKREVERIRYQQESDTLDTYKQLHMMNLLPLHQAGYKGKGIRIGVADGGFYHADSIAALAHARDRWLGYKDLTDGKDGFFEGTSNHGSLCLSTIMAQTEEYHGAAIEASYYLFRTEEHDTESLKEIDNWVAAIEMADSLGLHIVTTSLGYSTFDDETLDFSYADMDGKHSRGAKAATIAARKGMLLVVAAGNDGNNDWHYIATPADADSILTVGAVDEQGLAAAFSSYGPTADGRVKPEVCAMGKQTALLRPEDSSVFRSNGTSFACPLIAGMAACLWSAMPQASNMEIREYIIRSSHYYHTPHEQYGYGIPDAWLAYQQATATPNAATSPQSQKIMKHGQIYILHNQQYYNLLGQPVRL